MNMPREWMISRADLEFDDDVICDLDRIHNFPHRFFERAIEYSAYFAAIKERDEALACLKGKTMSFDPQTADFDALTDKLLAAEQEIEQLKARIDELEQNQL